MLISCVQTNWVCPSGTQRFCKNDSDSCHRLWLETNRVILWKTWLESSHHFSQGDSSRVRVTKNRDSSHAITGSSRSLCGHFLSKTWLNYFGWIDDCSQSLNRSRILKFKRLPDPDSKILEQEWSWSLKKWLRPALTWIGFGL